jgi:hypothetical protein
MFARHAAFEAEAFRLLGLTLILEADGPSYVA